jgi:hypothetical protein
MIMPGASSCGAWDDAAVFAPGSKQPLAHLTSARTILKGGLNPMLDRFEEAAARRLRAPQRAGFATPVPGEDDFEAPDEGVGTPEGVRHPPSQKVVQLSPATDQATVGRALSVPSSSPSGAMRPATTVEDDPFGPSWT